MKKLSTISAAALLSIFLFQTANAGDAAKADAAAEAATTMTEEMAAEATDTTAGTGEAAAEISAVEVTEEKQEEAK